MDKQSFASKDFYVKATEKLLIDYEKPERVTEDSLKMLLFYFKYACCIVAVKLVTSLLNYYLRLLPCEQRSLSKVTFV